MLRRPPRPPLPPSAHDVLREARLLRALEDTAARVPQVLAVCADEEMIGAPFYVMERVAGEVIVASVPARARLPGRAPPDRRAADRRAGRDPRGRLARRRARGLRQTDRLPRAPAAPLQRPLGAQQDARDRGRRERRGVARREPPRAAARRRSCTATTGSATRCSPRSRPPTWRRCSTGRWRRSATRWPTWATCA